MRNPNQSRAAFFFSITRVWKGLAYNVGPFWIAVEVGENLIQLWIQIEFKRIRNGLFETVNFFRKKFWLWLESNPSHRSCQSGALTTRPPGPIFVKKFVSLFGTWIDTFGIEMMLIPPKWQHGSVPLCHLGVPPSRFDWYFVNIGCDEYLLWSFVDSLRLKQLKRFYPGCFI